MKIKRACYVWWQKYFKKMYYLISLAQVLATQLELNSLTMVYQLSSLTIITGDAQNLLPTKWLIIDIDVFLNNS